LAQNVDCKYFYILILMPEFISEEGILYGKTVGYGKGNLNWA
jgi:hypothetical protein